MGVSGQFMTNLAKDLEKRLHSFFEEHPGAKMTFDGDYYLLITEGIMLEADSTRIFFAKDDENLYFISHCPVARGDVKEKMLFIVESLPTKTSSDSYPTEVLRFPFPL